MDPPISLLKGGDVRSSRLGSIRSYGKVSSVTDTEGSIPDNGAFLTPVVSPTFSSWLKDPSHLRETIRESPSEGSRGSVQSPEFMVFTPSFGSL